MAYLKGGTVVDGNLYVEGNLNIRGQSTEEGVKYGYIVNPNSILNRVVKIGNDGQLLPTLFTEDTQEAGLSKITLSEDREVSIVAFPGKISISGADAVKDKLYGISSGHLTDFDSNGLPLNEPEYWGYETSDRMVLVGTRSGDNIDYTMTPDNERGERMVDIGETVIVSGYVPE